MWLEKAMAHIPNTTVASRKADALVLYNQHSRRTNPAKLYLAAAHWNDCDVDYRFDGNVWRATLKPEAQHPDARRNLHKKKFKTPMPNRPPSGNNLHDGWLQSVWLWSNPGGVATRRTRSGASTSAASAMTSPKRNRSCPGLAQALSPMDIAVRAGHSPPNPHAARAPRPIHGEELSGQAAEESARRERQEEACERRREMRWHHPDDHRRVEPEAVDARGKMVCSFTMAVTLAERVQTHARSGCAGHLTWSPQRMTQKGCCGRMVGVCTEGENCCDSSLGENGELVWQSDEVHTKTSTGNSTRTQ